MGTEGKQDAKPKKYDNKLAETLEDSRAVRNLLRGPGKLIVWPSPEKVNVLTLEVLGLNSTVMCIVANYHCSTMSTLKAPGINFLKGQARLWKQMWYFQKFDIWGSIHRICSLHSFSLSFPISLSGLPSAEASCSKVRSSGNPSWCMGYQEVVLLRYEANRCRYKEWGWLQPQPQSTFGFA